MKSPRLTYPAAPRARYRRYLDEMIAAMRRDYVRSMKNLFAEYGDPMQDVADGLTMDANLGSQTRILLNFLSQKWHKRFSSRAQNIANSIIGQVDRNAKSNLDMSLKELSGGLTIKTPKMPGALAEKISAATAENVSLIKSVQAQYHERIQNTVLSSIQTGGRGAADVMEEITKAGEICHKRASFIATDQIKKVTVAMNAERAKSIGVTKFEWLHGSSAHPRPLHLDYNGEIFDINDPPVIDKKTGEKGLPGQLVNCRCTMRLIVDFSEVDEDEDDEVE